MHYKIVCYIVALAKYILDPNKCTAPLVQTLGVCMTVICTLQEESPYLITILLWKWIAEWLIELHDKAIWEDKMGVEIHLEM